MIGFLDDERRMNVSITRAKFLMIVVTNSNTLTSNDVWQKYVDFTFEKKCRGFVIKF